VGANTRKKPGDGGKTTGKGKTCNKDALLYRRITEAEGAMSFRGKEKHLMIPRRNAPTKVTTLRAYLESTTGSPRRGSRKEAEEKKKRQNERKKKGVPL